MDSEDILDQASNLRDVLRWLRVRSDVLQDRVGAMGISQGGWAVSMLAPEGVYDFSILLVTPSTSVFRQELDRVLYSMRADNRAENEIQAALAHTKLMLYCATGRVAWEVYAESQAMASKEPWSEYVSVNATEQNLRWWQRNNYDPENDLRKMEARTLAVYGGVDTLVPVATNRDRMESLLQSANPKSHVWTAEGCGHGLESFATLLGGEWNWPECFWVWPKKASGLYQRLENFIRG
jgi:pimeloyl-ACP methyl ester carboxylesterase